MTWTSRPDARQSGRYLMAGALCALLNTVILIGGDELGIHYVISNLVAFAIVSTAAFVLHTRSTFGVAPNMRLYIRFIAGLISAFVVSTTLYALIYDAMNVPMVIASPMITAMILAYNFVVARIALTSGETVSQSGK